MFKELTILQSVAERKIKRDQKGNWSKGSITYLEALKDEIEEVEAEFKGHKRCFLEDELGDLLWVYLCLIENLEVEGKISKAKVFERSSTKYQERIDGIENGLNWSDIKKVQKERLNREAL